MRPRNLTIAMAMSLVILGAVTLLADDPGKTATNDAIGKKLEAARKKFDGQVAKAKRVVLERLKKAENVAKRAGKLDGLERIEEERKKFESEGMIPSSVSTRDYENELRRARRDLARALSQAIAAYTKKGSLDAAQRTQDELIKLKKEIDLDVFYQSPMWEARVVEGQWSIVGNELVQAPRGNGHLLLGDPGTSNYNFEFEAKATEGEGCIVVKFHWKYRENTYIEMLLGASGTSHLLQCRLDGRFRRLPAGEMGGATAIGRWYKIRLEVRGEEYRCFLD
ncbi:MAG: hypothetical protein IRY99_26365, partial [Isosphaeraceae bacterium]|nr:hypothetical protein [Isosphaeraceae bacterium]